MPDFDVLSAIEVELHLVIFKPIDIDAVGESNLVHLLLLEVIHDVLVCQSLLDISILEVDDRVPTWEGILSSPIIIDHLFAAVTVKISGQFVLVISSGVDQSPCCQFRRVFVHAILDVVFIAEKILNHLVVHHLYGKLDLCQIGELHGRAILNSFLFGSLPTFVLIFQILIVILAIVVEFVGSPLVVGRI